MKSIKEYDRLVCTAVRNDPLGFIDILQEAAGDEANRNVEGLLREAACVIASYNFV